MPISVEKAGTVVPLSEHLYLERSSARHEGYAVLNAEWQGMPEFVQSKIEPYAKIILRVESKEDLDKLSELLGQPLTPKTKSAWFPFKSHWGTAIKVWVSAP